MSLVKKYVAGLLKGPETVFRGLCFTPKLPLIQYFISRPFVVKFMMSEPNNVLFLTAITMDIVATLLLAIGLIMTHAKMVKERSIDDTVVVSLHREAYMAYTALALIIASFVLIIIDEVRQSS